MNMVKQSKSNKNKIEIARKCANLFSQIITSKERFTRELGLAIYNGKKVPYRVSFLKGDATSLSAKFEGLIFLLHTHISEALYLSIQDKMHMIFASLLNKSNVIYGIFSPYTMEIKLYEISHEDEAIRLFRSILMNKSPAICLKEIYDIDIRCIGVFDAKKCTNKKFWLDILDRFETKEDYIC